MYRLRTFGALALERDGASLDNVSAHRKALALLAVVAAQGSVARDWLIALLWPESDEERARGSLKQTLHVLRGQLDAPDLLVGTTELRLNPEHIESDVHLFSAALEEGELATAVRHYAGPFLDGVHVSGAPELERWADTKRAELARRYAEALEQLARAAGKRGEHAAAVRWWRRLQAADPLNARVAVELMEALDAAGDPAGALSHARVHEVLLREELGIGPDAAVTALATRLRVPEPSPPPSPQPNDVAADAAPPVRTVAPPVTGPRWNRRPALLVLGGVLLVLVTSATLVLGRGDDAIPTTAPNGSPGALTTTARGVVEQGSIAVLPFVDMSPDSDQQYFSDGMTEELTNHLSKVGGLRVAARTSAYQFKGRNPDVREAADKLGVATVVEGSVRKARGRLRITAQLIDARSGYHLWSETYDRDLDDVFAVQDEISRAIVEALRIRLAAPAAPPRRMTNNALAYDQYLRGRHFLRQHTRDGTRRAAESFRQAIAADPAMAKAYVGLADVELSPGLTAPGERFRRAKMAAQRALALDSTLAEAHAALGWVNMWYDRDWTGAERHIKRALALDPGYAWTYNVYSSYLTAVGRMKESLDMMRRAFELVPSIPNTAFLAMRLLRLGRTDEAISYYRSALALDSTFFMAHWGLGRAYLQLGRYDEALKELAPLGTDYGGFYRAGLLGYAHALAGHDAEARRILAGLHARMANGGYVAPTDLAAIHIGLGEHEQALDWLEKHEADRGARIFLKGDPIFDPVRREPRFQRLLERLGLS